MKYANTSSLWANEVSAGYPSALFSSIGDSVVTADTSRETWVVSSHKDRPLCRQNPDFMGEAKEKKGFDAMRKHTWVIVLSQKEIPDIIHNAFPGIQQQSLKGVGGNYELRAITYDPITDAQFALLIQASLSEYGMCSLSCSSEEVHSHYRPEKTPEGEANAEYLYTFTLRGHIAVVEEDGEAIAYGWIQTALEDLALDLPEELRKQVKDFKIGSVDLFLEGKNSED